MTITSAADMGYYSTDLLEHPRLSKAETAAIIASVPASEVQASPPSERAVQAKERLILAHLRSAVYTATTPCPKGLCATLVPDLVQEANLALVRAVECYN